MPQTDFITFRGEDAIKVLRVLFVLAKPEYLKERKAKAAMFKDALEVYDSLMSSAKIRRSKKASK